MADAITSARQMIENRIREIEEETARLKGALAELAGDGGGRGARRRGSGAARSFGRRARKTAPRGQRREQLLAHLEQNPGARPTAIGKAMGTTPANVQNVLRKARQNEVVRKLADGGYALAGGRSGPSDAPEASAGQAEPGTPVEP